VLLITSFAWTILYRSVLDFGKGRMQPTADGQVQKFGAEIAPL
jgi:hypothetical protein